MDAVPEILSPVESALKNAEKENGEVCHGRLKPIRAFCPLRYNSRSAYAERLFCSLQLWNPGQRIQGFTG